MPTSPDSPSPAAPELPDLAVIRAAAERIAPHVHRTPVLRCSALDRLAGARLHFKCEPFQRGGAFKVRGATNAVLSLGEEEARRGVVTHSSGNHGAALALAARTRGIPAWVVMPEDAPRVKREAVAGYGATVVLCEPTAEARAATAERVVGETGAALVHSYDDPRVIAGQGTVALELLAQVARLDAVVVPVGGGGLISGVAIAVAALAPGTRVLGAEPAAADDAARSLAAGRLLPNPPGRVATVADGLKASLAERTFLAVGRHVERVVVVSEEEIVAAMCRVWERMKVIVEPSAAVAVAAVLSGVFAGAEPPEVGVVLSGGNVDLDRLPW
ncbi:MAG TPA: pyridoxal-phosphate dependent enzyme [Thermoanaerobaculia bacterium]|nr:pyridoxal-phosphate dependent enzyme [Thermoanaerobaculia bacterium]